MRKRPTETATTFMLVVVYLFLSVRYFPADAGRTIMETLLHLAGTAPFSLGLTLFVILAVRKLAGQQPAGIFICRLFLTLGILMEFLYGIQAYLAKIPA